MRTLIMTYPVTTAAIELVMEAIEGALDSAIHDAHEVFQIMTCCREALNNIVEHSGGSWFTTRFRLANFGERNAVVIAFRYRGTEFQPPSQTETPLNAGSGRGWPIMQAWMDRAHATCHRDTVRVTLSKRLTTNQT
ncbi:ATP-binding protein [Marinobacter salinisoli]|uniref:ATP-binding protein n=1 Tax=Marinobacter salinisoli TaxID=2769486 RepID=A0ABX7MNW1_9GAMM|nr:ATP-binding protein [Marinobacter salinisoli]QSP93972.1 ATP-binding protein [Marinobacter salinisoli]